MKSVTILGAVLLLAPASQAQRVISRTVVVSAPVAQVYKAWTTPSGLESFFAKKATVELKPGGRFEVLFSPEAPKGQRGAEDLNVLSFVQDRMFSFSWNAPPQFPEIRKQRTFVVLQFAPVAGNYTQVELTHGGWGQGADWDKVYAYFEKAWPQVLDSLKAHFAAPAPSDGASQRVLDQLSRLIGGVWTGEVKGPEGPLVVEFTYERHPDGKGVVGHGVIGKGSAKPVHVRNSFGIDPLTGKVYYLDSHNSGTVYYGHAGLEDGAFTFVFGPAGGKMDTFYSKSKLVDDDTLQSLIKGKDGQEMAGFTLKRKR